MFLEWTLPILGIQSAWSRDPRLSTLILCMFIFGGSLKNLHSFDFGPRLSFVVSAIMTLLFLRQVDLSLTLFGHSDKLAMYQTARYWIDSIAILTVLAIQMKPKQLFGTLQSLCYPIITTAVAALMSYRMIITDQHSYLANSVNFQIVIHSIVQSSFGNLPFSEISSQYGGYGLFIGLVFRFFNAQPSIAEITALLALVNFISLGLLGFVVSRLVSGFFVRTALLLSIVYWQYFGLTNWPGELYFQLYPIRLFFPMVAVAAAFLIGVRSREIRSSLLMGVIAAGSLLWNLETGLVIVVAISFAFARSRAWSSGVVYLTTTVLCFLFYVWFVDGFQFELFFRYLIMYTGADVKGPLTGLLLSRVWVVPVTTLAIALITTRTDDFARSLLVSVGLGLFSYHLLKTGDHESNMAVAIWTVPLAAAIVFKNLVANRDPASNSQRSATPILALCSLIPLALSSSAFIHIHEWTISKDTNKFHHYLDQKSTRVSFATAADYGGSELRYVTIADQLSGDLSPWEIRSRFAAGLANPQHSTDLLFLSDWDSLMYLHAQAKAPVSWANYNHAFRDADFQEVVEKILMGSIRRVVIDQPSDGYTSSILGNYETRTQLLNFVYECFQLKSTSDGGPRYSLTPEPRWVPSTLSVWVRDESKLQSNDCTSYVISS